MKKNINNHFLWRTHMKSFSFKALALALVVVGSANAGFVDTVKGYATSAKNRVAGVVTKTDKRVFGEYKHVTLPWPHNICPNTQLVGGLPVFRSYLRFN